jgi:hypothetical protein
MRINGELERNDIAVDPEIIISEDGNCLEAYIETWFDVDRKFGTNTQDDDSTWVNLYASYNPQENMLEMQYVVDSSMNVDCYPYEPTKAEKHLIIQLIKEKIIELYGVTPEAFLINFAA